MIVLPRFAARWGNSSVRVLPVCALLTLTGSHPTAAPAGAGDTAIGTESAAGIAAARSNDNRMPAGRLRSGVLTLSLEVRRARWFPESADGRSEEVETFAERGGPATIPGPLIRIPAGTVIDLSIRNPLGAPLVLFGLHPRPGAETDSIVVSPGSTRRLRFAAGAPGTYFYWGSTTGDGMGKRHGADSQLSGAFIVDPAGTRASPTDRIFVMGVWGTDVDSSGPKPWLTRDMMVINGKSWPYTERFEYEVGDSVHWRWLNPTRDGHPMHLHGFYFDVLSRGSWAGDTIYSRGEHRKVVTETMFPGGTMTMAWSPSRPGNWLFHCHFTFHVSNFLSFDLVPDPTDPDSPDGMDPTAHAMRGLILGIQVRTPDASLVASRTDTMTRSGLPVRHIRLLAQSARARYGKADGYAFVVQRDSIPPAPDSVPSLSSALVLTRGEPVAITVVNHLRLPTAVHWHGIEVQESYVDGVPGWSGARGRLAPAIAPGDSFVAAFTPDRAGTFIYHSHSNEGHQISAGLYGALIVLEQGETFDTTTERTFVLGANGSDQAHGRINGLLEPAPVELVAGRTYRFRLVSINTGRRVFVSLRSRAALAPWRALAKDGAALPANQAIVHSARVAMGPGETADFEVIPAEPGSLELEVQTQVDGWKMAVPISVRAPR